MARTQALFTIGALVALALSACSGEDTTNTTAPGTGGSGNKSSSSAGGNGFGANGSGNDTNCADCVDHAVGVGTNNPFDPDNNPSDGVGVDDDGALVLDSSNANIPGIIWIANTANDTVTKVDTTTYAILGQYETGSNDPSRTSVNSAGDVFVGNRAGNVITKILGAGADCPDTNGDNAITTSTGYGDILMWGEDDCAAWQSAVPNNPHVRGVAAQDLIVPDPQPDWPEKTKIEHYVWAGGTNHATAYKFDGDDGSLLIQTQAPTSVYGLALDGSGNLWISGRGEDVLGRIDTNQCHDQASCDAAFTQMCTRDCRAGGCACQAGCATTCDAAPMERILMPAYGGHLYGITVDFKQRVWLGGQRVMRYDPAQPDAMRYAEVSTAWGCDSGICIHGIAADAEGFVWGASRNRGILRIDGDTLATNLLDVPDAKGMAIDKDGKIWGISHNANGNVPADPAGNEAHVIIPGVTIDVNTVQPGVLPNDLGTCYTYSDMTGLQLALALNDPGYYRQTEEGCPAGTEWVTLDWEAEVPPGTRIQFAVRTANTVADLGNAQWVHVASMPPDMPPIDISAKLQTAGVDSGRFLEWEVSLEGTVDQGTGQLLGPRVLMVNVQHHCPPVAE